jgi:carotenoid cleavage dioxygenase-like enzyme
MHPLAGKTKQVSASQSRQGRLRNDAGNSAVPSGWVRPVAEEITAFDLPVTGRIPTELSGRYLRNGPDPLGLEGPGYHWFVGGGMVHGVRLRDGRAEWYRNRWVRSRGLTAGQAAPPVLEAWLTETALSGLGI